MKSALETGWKSVQSDRRVPVDVLCLYHAVYLLFGAVRVDSRVASRYRLYACQLTVKSRDKLFNVSVPVLRLTVDGFRRFDGSLTHMR